MMVIKSVKHARFLLRVFVHQELRFFLYRLLYKVSDLELDGIEREFRDWWLDVLFEQWMEDAVKKQNG